MKHCVRTFCRKPLAVGIAAALMATTAPQALAAKWQVGDVDISFDSTFSYGSAWRVEDRDWTNQVGKSNNLNNGFDFSNWTIANQVPGQQQVWDGLGSYSTNGDLGNLNFDSGEQFSSLVKGTHELEVQYENIGFFVRGTYFYDFAMSDSDRPWANQLTGITNDPCRDDEAAERICSDVRLLDAFVYGDFELGEMPFSVRVGQQVINWGESTLISHGISETNAVDIAILRAPGSELKEAFIPAGAVWASLGVSENFNVEAFYQYEWEKTILPPPGSYFSTNDFAGFGGQHNLIQLGFAANPDIDLDYLLANLNALGQGVAAGVVDPVTAGTALTGYATKVTLRGTSAVAESEPKDGGQYGLRLSWYLPSLNDTELSAYYMNYHSRRPLFSGKTADFTRAENNVTKLARLAARGEVLDESNFTNLDMFSQLVLAYPEDIKMYAMSFNTTLGATSWAGEISYRQDEPLQIDDVELIFAAMPQQLANTGDPAFAALDGISQLNDPATGQPYGSGEVADGFILSDTVQAQMTFTNLWGPTIGASQFTTLLEVGGININDMPEQDVLRLNGPGTARSGGIASAPGLNDFIQDGVETNPFPTEFAWGYRLVGKLDYTNVFGMFNVSPRAVFAHDVSGITPDPLFLFIEDRKSLSLGVSFDYQSKWSADVSYNSFFDGVGTTNQLSDRDFVSFNIKYSI
ncbi:DUF1302 domain-containing protein [Thalassotalea agarivorans]|uniref:DUF1302 domain-containing protein n=1 Tax=Thalassotalea agarivorans TaxID=349064 RepID=A0A1I0BX83_THASX|nr:DUF1302 domain-containing protein [Thalassotalea agarivorans]SET11592.1 Protein of unknown function [Thalassotalea agarivorans]